MTTAGRRTGSVTANYPWMKKRVRRALADSGANYIEQDCGWFSRFSVTGTVEQWQRLAWALGYSLEDTDGDSQQGLRA